MHSIEELRDKFTKYLTDYEFPKKPAALYGACRHILSIGGKRIRPILCLMAADAFGAINDNIMKASLAIELFHNFSLVHDDIMDEADIRRGEMTVHKKYSEPTAILSGDVLNVYAYQLLNELDFEDMKAVFDLYNQTAIEVCEGQQMDMDFETMEDVSTDEYIQMITLKTSVLLAGSLKLGAMLCNASAEDTDLIYEFGKKVGIAFQLKDDYLDAYGESSKTGKKVGGDIMANKKTIFYCHITDVADEAMLLKIENLQNSMSSEKIAETLKVYDELGARDYVRKLKEQYSQEAFIALDKVKLAEDKKSQLRLLALSLLDRQS